MCPDGTCWRGRIRPNAWRSDWFLWHVEAVVAPPYQILRDRVRSSPWHLLSRPGLGLQKVTKVCTINTPNPIYYSTNLHLLWGRPALTLTHELGPGITLRGEANVCFVSRRTLGSLTTRGLLARQVRGTYFYFNTRILDCLAILFLSKHSKIQIIYITIYTIPKIPRTHQN